MGSRVIIIMDRASHSNNGSQDAYPWTVLEGEERYQGAQSLHDTLQGAATRPCHQHCQHLRCNNATVPAQRCACIKG